MTLEQATQDYWVKSTYYHQTLTDPAAKQSYLAATIVPLVNVSAKTQPDRSRILSRLLQ